MAALRRISNFGLESRECLFNPQSAIPNPHSPDGVRLFNQVNCSKSWRNYFLTEELLKWRSEFPILDKAVYLISHSLGAMPKGTYDSLHEYAEKWATRGVRAWAEGWWEMPVTLGDELATIIGADPGTIVMHQNVSVCQSLILSCLEPTPERNKIVYSELNFPSVMYVYEAHARDGKLKIDIVKSDDGITVPLERMLAAIDETTLLVPFSHVLFKSAFLQDAKAIIDRAHEVGAMVV